MENTVTNKKTRNGQTIPPLQLKQLQYECGTWKRALDFIMEENIHLKNRLAEILKDKFDKYLLEDVDGFQSRFVKKDGMISMVRYDIAELEKILENASTAEINRKVKDIRKNLSNLEKNFGKLKTEFNHFLSQNIL